MITVLDIAEVGNDVLDEYLRVLVGEYLPGVRKRGLEVSVCSTSLSREGSVEVVVVLAATEWEAWATARSLASRDPSVADCFRRLRALARSTTRRFLVPVDGGAA